MKKNVKIALTVIVSLCLLYWGIDYLKGINLFTPANYFYSTFDTVDGLVEGAPVQVNGFKIGLVHQLRFDYETNRVKVMMSLDKNLKVPVGTTSSIRSSLTGTASLVLNLADDKTYLAVGDEIPGIDSAGLMDKVSEDLMPQVVAMLPKLDSIMTNLNRLTSDPALAASVGRLNDITAQLSNSSRQLTALMTSLNGSVPVVMNNVKDITANLDGASANFVDISGNIKQLPLDQTVANLNKTVSNIEAMSAKLNSKDSSLGLLLNDRAFYDHADATVASLDSLFVDIRKHPKRYVTIKVF